MTDVLTPEQRHSNMRNIRGRDTKPEMLIRRGLHAHGLRFRLHDRTLPGSPDLVFPRYHAVVFVHGCFWHLHGCSLSTLPNTRQGFWQKKFEANISRDKKAITTLLATGWRVLVIWECALRGPRCLNQEGVLDSAEYFIVRGQDSFHSIEGRGVTKHS